MKIIHFQADGTTLTVDQTDRQGLVAGCHGYYELDFNLSKDFNGFLVACEFQAGDNIRYASLINGKCKLPDSIADAKNYKVRLIAQKDNLQIVTTRVLLEQEGGGLSA